MTALPIGEPVDARPASLPLRAPMTGRFVSIVPFNLATHGPDIFNGSAGTLNEGLWAYLGQGPFDSYQSFAAHYSVAATKDDPLLYAIVDRSTGRTVGHLTYLRIAPADRVIEVGNILFTPALQHRPGGTEAIYLMARNAFETLGYRRFEWKCNALNAPSRRAATRFGFSYEGTFRQHMIMKGRNRDTAWFSMIDHEWPRARGAFERWLDPANFDAEGQQKTSLAALRDLG